MSFDQTKVREEQAAYHPTEEERARAWWTTAWGEELDRGLVPAHSPEAGSTREDPPPGASTGAPTSEKARPGSR